MERCQSESPESAVVVLRPFLGGVGVGSVVGEGGRLAAIYEASGGDWSGWWELGLGLFVVRTLTSRLERICR